MADPNKKSPREADTAVGQAIRARRMAIGMSQEKLGDALGVTFQQVQKYEKGTNRVSASRLVDIARVLGCRIEDLLAGEAGAPPQATAMSRFMTSREGHKVAAAFDQVTDPEKRRKLVGVVETIAGLSAA